MSRVKCPCGWQLSWFIDTATKQSEQACANPNHTDDQLARGNAHRVYVDGKRRRDLEPATGKLCIDVAVRG